MLDFHSAVILASIEQTTLSATRRRKPHAWPWAVLAGLSLCALLAVLVAVAK